MPTITAIRITTHITDPVQATFWTLRVLQPRRAPIDEHITSF